MNAATISLIIGLVEEAIKEYPAIVADIQAIFSKPNPTPQDWAELRLKVLSKSYKDYVPDTQLPQ